MAKKRATELAENIPKVGKKKQKGKGRRNQGTLSDRQTEQMSKEKGNRDFGEPTRTFPSKREGNIELLANTRWPINRKCGT